MDELTGLGQLSLAALSQPFCSDVGPGNARDFAGAPGGGLCVKYACTAYPRIGLLREVIEACEEMTSPATPSYLRLVGCSEAVRPARDADRRRAVACENRSASTNRQLRPSDPRWVLAARAYAQLDGAALSPQRRQRLIHTARQLGLRPFDANLIIAIVQDRARRQQPLSEAEPSLRLIAPPIAQQRSAWSRWIGATALAVLANALLIWWLLSVV